MKFNHSPIAIGLTDYWQGEVGGIRSINVDFNPNAK